MSNIKEKILNILTPHRLNSYFNLSFYQFIQKKIFVVGNFKSQILPNSITLNNKLVSMEDCEVIIIYNLLCCLFENKKLFSKYINNYFYRLTSLTLSKHLYNVCNYDICKIKRKYNVTPLYKNCFDYKFKSSLEISCRIDNIDVLNCNSNTTDVIKFDMFYEDDITDGQIIKKDIYNLNDLNILTLLIKNIAYHDFSIIYQYLYNIIDFYKRNNYDIENNNTLQHIISNILIFVHEYELHNHYSCRILIENSNLNTLINTIDIISISDYKFINKTLIPILLQYIKNFKMLILLSSYL